MREKEKEKKKKTYNMRRGLIALALTLALTSGLEVPLDPRDGMEMDKPKEFHPEHAMSKSFHWILSVVLLLIVPSVSACIALANRLSMSVGLHMVLVAWLVFDTLFLTFPDPEGHENRVSTGTSWALALTLGGTVFVGTLVNGSNLVINKFYPQLADRYAQGTGTFLTRTYKTLSVVVVLMGWVRVCMAPIALFGFCYGKHTGQCIAHGIMGLSFIGYGFVLLLVLVVPWFRNRDHGRSQEFYDSLVMFMWGIVNTFTEHRWGKEGWSMGDYDHTSMGIVWACGGLLGLWLSRNKRSFIPSILLIYTGWSMSQHVQHLEISTKVHGMFGLVLMASGFTRIVEILFILSDKFHSDSGQIISFQYLPPTCLVLSGLLFMSANEEQLVLVHDLAAPYASYVLTVLSAGFIILLWMVLLVNFYLKLVGYDENGIIIVSDDEFHRVDDVEQFELGDLSDDNMRH